MNESLKYTPEPNKHSTITLNLSITVSADEIKPFAEAICDQTNSQNYSSYLSIHPARKLVMDFLRDLLNDAMPSSSKPPAAILETIYASLPENQLKRNQELLTELLKTIIDYLVGSDFFNDQTQQQEQTSIQNQSVIFQNFFNLIDQVVDKLWDGNYRRDAKELFETLVRFLNNLKKKNVSTSVSNEQLINALNRVLLYQLSRPAESLVDQVNMLEVLHKMTSLKAVIFSQTNFQAEFFACVTHCLLILTLRDEDMLGANGDQDNDSVYNNINMVSSAVNGYNTVL